MVNTLTLMVLNPNISCFETALILIKINAVFLSVCKYRLSSNLNRGHIKVHINIQLDKD